MKGWDNCPRCGGSGFAGGLLLCNDPAPPPPRRYLAEEWERFEQMCIPPTAGAMQRHTMRDAFYAGAKALFCTMENEVSNESEVTPQDEQVMVLLDRELREYGAELHERAALIRQRREGRG